MALYVDSALIDEVADICARYPVTGITTNPTILLAAEKQGQHLPLEKLLQQLLAIGNGPVFSQPVGDDYETLLAESRRAVAVDPARVVLKLPMSTIGIAVGWRLREEKARFSYTAVTSPQQAYLGMLTGAEWIIAYFGRLSKAGIDPQERITQFSRLLQAQQSASHILTASIHSAEELIGALSAGSHDVTVQPEVIRTFAEDALSQAAIEQFNADGRRLADLMK